MKKRLGNLISKVFISFSVLVFLWIFLSFVDVVSDNCMPNPTHSEYNFFSVVFNLEDEEVN